MARPSGNFWNKEQIYLQKTLAFFSSIVYNSKSHFGVWRSLVSRLVRDQEAMGSNPVTPTMKKVTFVYRQRWLFSMISVPCGTGDISSIWYRTVVRWYMPAAYEERILYHACEASISYGLPYIISRQRYIIEKHNALGSQKGCRGAFLYSVE